MKITITIPKEVYDKLEKDRGKIPRSTYIQDLIKCFGEGVGNITPQHILGKSSDVYGNAIQPQVKVSDVTASKGVEESKMFAGSGDTYLS